MAEIPIQRIQFSGVVTLGNILTIIGGIAIAAALVYKVGEFTASIDGIRQDIAQIKCDLASHDLGSTIGPCTFKGAK